MTGGDLRVVGTGQTGKYETTDYESVKANSPYVNLEADVSSISNSNAVLQLVYK